MDVAMQEDKTGATTESSQARLIPARFRTRSVLAGGRLPGTEFFNSAEHWSIVDGMQLRMANGSAHEAAHFLFDLDNGCKLSFGQIIALAGDFYAIPKEPISDQPDKRAAFRKTFETLNGADKSEVEDILSIMAEEFQAIARAILNGEAPHTAYDQNHAEWDAKYNVATDGRDGWLYYLDINKWGRYLWLASYNWDHFGAHAHDVFKAGLEVAMDTAANASKQSGAARNNGLLKAYQYLAFASHYLTDSFSAGHVRTPRRHLHNFSLAHTSAFDFASDTCAQAMHDEDNFNGLWVHNDAGDRWIAYGDGRYFDGVNRANRNVMRAAVRKAIDDVYQSFLAGRPLASPTSPPLMPKPTLKPTDTDNFSPLFIAMEPLAWLRTGLTDPRRYEWQRVYSSVDFPVWQFMALDLQVPNKLPRIGAPPKNGTASGPNVGDRGMVSSWLEQGRLWQRPGHPLTTNASPAIAAYEGKRWVCVRQGNRLLIGTHSDRWSEFVPLKIAGDDVQTSTGPSLVVHEGALHCFYADFEGKLQWLQMHGSDWLRHGTVMVNGQPAQTDATPAAVSMPQSNCLALLYKGYRSSFLYYSFRVPAQSGWLANTTIDLGGTLVMTDDQPVAATTPGGVFVYYRAHAGYTIYRMELQNDAKLPFKFAGNRPVTLLDGEAAWTSKAVAASVGVDASTTLMVVPRDAGHLFSISQLRIGKTSAFQYMEDKVQAAIGTRLNSTITPALALFEGTYWLLTVGANTGEVTLTFGEP